MAIPKFFPQLKIKHKLLGMIPLYFTLLLVVIYFYFDSSQMIEKNSQHQEVLSAINVDIRNITLSVKDFISRSIRFVDIDDQYNRLVARLEGDPLQKDFKSMKKEIEKIDRLYKSNSAIELEISNLADSSIKNSNEYIKTMSQKLADENTRSGVSTLERLVIIGANTNTSANYDIKVLFGQLKENSGLKSKLLNFLDQLLKNVEKDIKNLAGTPFYQFAEESKKANLRIKELAENYILNTEEVFSTQKIIFHQIENAIEKIDTINIQSRKHLFDSIRNSFTTILFIIVLIIVIGTVTSLVFSRTISGSINELSSMVKDLASGEGDLTIRLKLASKDEMGELAKWFNVFIEKIHSIVIKISQNATELNDAANSLSNISGRLTEGTAITSSKANNVAVAIEEMSFNMHSVAAAMEQASTNVEMISSGAEEMTSTIMEIAENTENTRSITGKAVKQSDACFEQVSSLGNAANDIGKVVEIITDISDQVNLLALNATIESARAGEAGKGFAVVAHEIKELATQTSDAALGIKVKIQGIQDLTGETAKEIQNIAATIKDVDDVVVSIATAIEEQSIATREIADNVSQASQGMMEVSENVTRSSSVSSDIAKDIVQVNSEANDMSQNAFQVNNSATTLESLANQLKKMVDTFKI